MRRWPTDLFELEWGSDKREAPSSPDELIDRLLDLHRSSVAHPQVVEIVSPRGDRLGIGVGREETALNWIGANLDPPYFTTKGDAESDEPVLVFFYQGDHWTEYPRHSAIPFERAVEAAKRFLEMGKRPDNVAWQEV